MNLGKWLVLFSYGQLDQSSAQQDIMDYVGANPTGVDPDTAQNVATNYFVTQTKRQPSEEENTVLQQWINLVSNPVPQDQQGFENELSI